MRKSLQKRIRFTKNGKVVRRPMATDHFRTRKGPLAIQQKRKTLSLNYPIKKLLSY